MYRLHTVPPGLFFDEAANLFDIDAVLKGARPLYFPANNGREPLFFYWASLFAARWGENAYAIRLASAVIGILTLPATFFCAREFALAWNSDRRRADWLGVAATFLLSATYLHLHYSRIGLRTIMLPLFLALAFGLLLRGLRLNSWWAVLASGVLGGASIYTYISSRIAPLLLVIPPIALAGGNRGGWAIRRMLSVAVLWALVCVPLGLYTLQHASEIQGHTDDVSILNPVNNHGKPVEAVVHGVVATLASFSVVGTDAPEQNLPFRPILDPIQTLFFFIGLGVLVAGALRALRPDATQKSAGPSVPPVELRPVVALLLVAWILDQAVPSALAVNPPGFIRMTGTLPALTIAGGFGATSTYRWLSARVKWRGFAAVTVVLLLLVSGGLTFRDYFLRWAPSPEAYHLMMADKVDAATYLNQVAPVERVFLAPLYATDNTIKFLTRDVSIDSFDIGGGLIIPTDRSRDVEYDFPADDGKEANLVASELPGSVSRSTLTDSATGNPLLQRLNVAAANLPAPPTPIARFGDNIELTSAAIASTGPEAAQATIVTLVWLAESQTRDDYTVFVHLRNSSNVTVGQTDGQPVAGTVPTSRWRPGDLVWDRHQLMATTPLPAGRYRVVVGLYRRADLQRLPVEATSQPSGMNEFEVGSVDFTR